MWSHEMLGASALQRCMHLYALLVETRLLCADIVLEVIGRQESALIDLPDTNHGGWR